MLGPHTAEFTLSAGDVLYLPRGVVHEAVTMPPRDHLREDVGDGEGGHDGDGGPSLHLTFSTCQRHTGQSCG